MAVLRGGGLAAANDLQESHRVLSRWMEGAKEEGEGTPLIPRMEERRRERRGEESALDGRLRWVREGGREAASSFQ